MKETFYDGSRGWLNYELDGGALLVFMTAEEPVAVQKEWAVTPAFTRGVVHEASWVLEVSSEDFEAVLQRIDAAGIESSRDLQEGQPGRGLFVRDPMGKTIEVYSAA